MKTTTKNTNTTALPMDLIDAELFNKLDNQSTLQAPERELIAVYLMNNKIGETAQQRINGFINEGKQGMTKIINVAKWLKANNQSTATLKVQVNRAMNKAKTGLSLQGLGKDQTPTIAPKQANTKGASKDKENDTLVIQMDVDSFDQDAFDAMFINDWDIETQQYFIEHCVKMKATALKAKAKKIKVA